MFFHFQFFLPTEIDSKQLPKLNDDVLHLIFEQCKFSTLLRAIESDAMFEQPAIWAFRHAHAHQLIKINGPNFFLGSKFNASIGKEQGSIEIQDYALTLKLFDIFGDSVQNLHIDYLTMKPFQIAEITQTIHKKSSQKLKHLTITFSRIDLTTLYLPVVESVVFSAGSPNNNLTVNLNESFPKMRSLTFELYVNANEDIIDHHFVYLEHFGISFSPDNGLTEAQVERMFRKNPQIKSVRVVDHFSPRFLSILHENLPNLERLAITCDFFADNDYVLRFQNMKHFTLQAVSFISELPHVKVPFEFGDQLDTVTLIWNCMEIDNQWAQFIESNTNIQKLTVQFRFKNCAKFGNLSDLRLENLREVELHGIDLTANKQFDGFMNNTKHWQMLETIRLVDVPRRQIDVSKAIIDSKWRWTQFGNANSDETIDIVIAKTLGSSKV